MDEFVKLIKHRRTQKGLSTRELSRMVGMSPSYISELERGRVKRPTYSVAKAIADVLEIQESVLEYYGFLPEEVAEYFAKSAERNSEQYEEMQKVYVEQVTSRVESMSLEYLEMLSYILDNHSDIMEKLTGIEEMSHNSRSAFTAIREFVDFIFTKYVPEDFR